MLVYRRVTTSIKFADTHLYTWVERGTVIVMCLKPRPNDRNMSPQHIATLLGATCCARLAPVLRCVARCWVYVVGSSLKMVKFEPTTTNMSQHVTTRWPNARNMLRPTMLRYVALTCCDRLAGAFLKNITQCPRTELEPEPLDPETSALNMKPPRPPSLLWCDKRHSYGRGFIYSLVPS